MPTISQLPPAADIAPTDLLLLDQSGQTLSVTAALLLAGTQSRLTLAEGTILGRASSPSGSPEALSVGLGLVQNAGSLQVDTGLLATSANPVFTGRPTAPTPPVGDASSAIATTAFVASAQHVVTGADLSAGTVVAAGSTTARSLGDRLSEQTDLLDFGADPTGTADSSAAFMAAIASVGTRHAALVTVPSGLYRLSRDIAQPGNCSIAIRFQDGASLTGPGRLLVDRVEVARGRNRLSWAGAPFSGASVSWQADAAAPLSTEIITKAAGEPSSAGAAWNRTYSNAGVYTTGEIGQAIAEQTTAIWAQLLDGTAAVARADTVQGPTVDEETAQLAQLGGSVEHARVSVVNNAGEGGWSAKPATGVSVSGTTLQVGSGEAPYSGHIHHAFAATGLQSSSGPVPNCRWISYPAIHSSAEPSAVPPASSITISFDVHARATANVTRGKVVSFAMVSGGGAYTGIPIVALEGGGGSGAVATPLMTAGFVTGIAVTDGGAGYTTAPVVSFAGGGAPAATPTTVTLNAAGGAGDIASVAAAINGADIPMVAAAVTAWAGVASRLVIFGSAPGDLGILTVTGPALAALAIAEGSYATPRGPTAFAFGARTGVTPGDIIVVNGNMVVVSGAGNAEDIASAVNASSTPGLVADVTASGEVVLSAWLAQQPAGLVLSDMTSGSTLAKLGWRSGVILPPTPPKAFATAASAIGPSACVPTDVLSLSATDFSGKTYGPITISLNGGAGGGSVADVVASIVAALRAEGMFSSTRAMLTVAPSIIACFVAGGGADPGVLIRNTSGGTLTLANVQGSPLETLGIAAGTYRPGGYVSGVQTAFLATADSLAPQGRGAFIGGSSAADSVVWPHAPVEVRGSFAHGVRLDQANFADGQALLLGPAQAIAWAGGGASLATIGGVLTSSVPAQMPGLNLSALPTSLLGLSPGTVWNNGGVLSIA